MTIAFFLFIGGLCALSFGMHRGWRDNWAGTPAGDGPGQELAALGVVLMFASAFASAMVLLGVRLP